MWGLEDIFGQANRKGKGRGVEASKDRGRDVQNAF